MTFDAAGDIPDAVERGGRTKLTEYFRFYQQNPGHTPHTYVDFPEFFTWNTAGDLPHWKPRVLDLGYRVIGRVYPVSPMAGERYFLRVLLHHVAGAASFEDMRRVNGVLRPSFQDACVQRGLLQDDREWRSCLEEARQIVFVPHCLCVCGTVWEVS